LYPFQAGYVLIGCPDSTQTSFSNYIEILFHLAKLNLLAKI
jgi:hypothetical protein